MRLVTHFFALLIALTVPISARAQTALPAPPTASDPVLSDASFLKGIDALYNLDFDNGRRQFEDVKRRFPDHPAGQYYLAANLFFQTLTKPNRLLPLLSDLSRSKTFEGDSEDKLDLATMQQFRSMTRQATLLAKVRLRHNPRDLVALYFLGATHGLIAAFKGTIEDGVVSAMREGSSGVDKHRELIKLDPTFHDAQFSIGVYEYTVGALPLPVKVMVAIANIRGSKKRGLETLELVGREGRLSRYIAKLVLITLYKREKRYDEALERARELTAKYPDSYLFKLGEADALISLADARRRTAPEMAGGLERKAFAILDSMLKTQRAANIRSAPSELIHFIYGESLLKAGLAEQAAREFMAAASAPGVEPSITTIAQLRAGQAFDLAGKRREAQTQYEIVLKRPDVYDSRDRAAQGLRKQYKE
ncbi:MAG: tetratricopeptide repeat protein [Pyrinomonadaceae bacterium]